MADGTVYMNVHNETFLCRVGDGPSPYVGTPLNVPVREEVARAVPHCLGPAEHRLGCCRLPYRPGQDRRHARESLLAERSRVTALTGAKGYGAIGREAARLLKAMGCNIIAANSSGQKKADEGVGPSPTTGCIGAETGSGLTEQYIIAGTGDKEGM